MMQSNFPSAPQLSRCYTWRDGGLVRFYRLSLFLTEFSWSSSTHPCTGDPSPSPFRSICRLLMPRLSIPPHARFRTYGGRLPRCPTTHSRPRHCRGSHRDPFGQLTILHPNECLPSYEYPRVHSDLNALIVSLMEGSVVPRPASGSKDSKQWFVMVCGTERLVIPF